MSEIANDSRENLVGTGYLDDGRQKDDNPAQRDAQEASVALGPCPGAAIGEDGEGEALGHRYVLAYEALRNTTPS